MAFRSLSFSIEVDFVHLQDTANAQSMIMMICFISYDLYVGIFFCGIERRARFCGEVAMAVYFSLWKLLF